MTTLEEIVIDTGGDPYGSGSTFSWFEERQKPSGAIVSYVDNRTGLIEKMWLSQYHATKARLQNKPSFADHPDAKCFVQNKDGEWFKNTGTINVQPTDMLGWRFDDDIGYWEKIQQGQVIGNWRDTLEVRPEQEEKTMKTVSDAVREFGGVWPDDRAENLVTTSAGWAGGDDYVGRIEPADGCHGMGPAAWVVLCTRTQFEAEAERLGYRDKQWSGDGLPPVGCECEWSLNGITWEGGKMLFNDGITCLIAHRKHPANRWHYKCADPDLRFRPLQSER